MTKYLKTLVLLIFIMVFFIGTPAFAQIAILNSSQNSSFWTQKHLGNYTELWQDFLYTFNHTNLKYTIISDDNIKNKELKKYKVLILPLLLDLSEETIKNIENYTDNNGKIILIYPGYSKYDSSKELAKNIGIITKKHKHLSKKSSVVWKYDSEYKKNDFPASTNIAELKLSEESEAIAYWEEYKKITPAIALSNKGCYISWRLGSSGSLNFNVNNLKKILQYLEPNIINNEQKTIDFKVFSAKSFEIEKLILDTSQFLDILLQDNNNTLSLIQENLLSAKMRKDLAFSFYLEKNYEGAFRELTLAKNDALKAYSKAIPSSLVEGRSIWIDRGTVVSIKNQEQMARLFDKLEKTGINIAYFETINAGYSVYESDYFKKSSNKKRDLLKWAIEEAHKRNIELHAWCWIFAAGNTRHNELIGKKQGYIGPILKKNKKWALIGNKKNNYLAYHQHEFWLDASNPEVQQFLLKTLEEIVEKYDVDGVQLDYIRYPFQGPPNNYMGYNKFAREKFEKEYELTLPYKNPPKNIVEKWNVWKAKQISNFVEKTSTSLRKIDPEIIISAAVFAMPKDKRMVQIQQDWETWINNGWIDVLNPMIYAKDEKKLSEQISYIKNAIGDKALVYPGIAIRQLEQSNLIEQIYKVKEFGLSGNTIFAMAHLSDEKSKLLSFGPYRIKNIISPSKEPIASSRVLTEEFMAKIEKIQSHCTLTSDDASEALLLQSSRLHSFLTTLSEKSTLTEIEKAQSMIQKLEELTNEWLLTMSSKKQIRDFLLNLYIDEINSLLNYKAHKLEKSL